eukprot:20129-Hanusia_phi.AAC.2
MERAGCRVEHGGGGEREEEEATGRDCVCTLRDGSRGDVKIRKSVEERRFAGSRQTVKNTTTSFLRRTFSSSVILFLLFPPP